MREVPGRHRDGRRLECEVSVSIAEAGDERLYCGIIREISARKQSERERDRLVRELAASNEDLEQFAHAASHDLKSPLRGIESAAQWLEEDLGGALTEDARQNLDLLRGRARRMRGLLGDLLQYARVGAGGDRRFAEQVTVGAVLDNVVSLQAPPAGFTVRWSERSANVIAARMPLEQILLNLIGNAIKHSDSGSGTITIEAEERGGRVHFAVGDDGPGIAPEFHDRVFAMFSTLRPRDQVEGSGIGLALVKRQVEQLGGRVELQSAVGAGAVFRFDLPCFGAPVMAGAPGPAMTVGRP
ncbi:MAG: PAS domain S-box protein [Planctomycetes bacterium]|nr:PAS domain S-box protein [Planctomycetota bacterium]